MILVDALLGIGGKLIDKLIPDPAAQDAARLELLKLQQSGELAAMLAQTDVNKVEAANSSVFVRMATSNRMGLCPGNGLPVPATALPGGI